MFKGGLGWPTHSRSRCKGSEGEDLWGDKEILNRFISVCEVLLQCNIPKTIRQELPGFGYWYNGWWRSESMASLGKS